MSGVAFSPSVLSSCEQLKSFFEANKNADKKRILSPLIKREIVAHFINHISNSIKILSLRLFKGLDRELIPMERIFIKNLIDDSDYNKVIFPFSRKDVLARAHNFQRIDTPDLYTQKTIPVSSIKNQKMRKFIDSNCGNLKDLVFFHNRGVCYGESMWFAILYFETKKKFPNTPEGRIQHIRAVTNIFLRGAPRAASLLHSLKLDFKNSFLCNVREQRFLSIFYKKTSPMGVRIENLDQLAKQIRNLLPGVYEFGATSHGTIYIKLDEQKAVFFDPNVGAILINGSEGERKLAEFIMKNYGLTKKVDNFMENLFMQDRILLIYKLTDLSGLSELEKRNLNLEESKVNLLSQIHYLSFPLRLCFFGTIQLVKNIYEKSVCYGIVA